MTVGIGIGGAGMKSERTLCAAVEAILAGRPEGSAPGAARHG